MDQSVRWCTLGGAAGTASSGRGGSVGGGLATPAPTRMQLMTTGLLQDIISTQIMLSMTIFVNDSFMWLY